MSLALASLRYMLIVAVVSVVMLGVLGFAMGDPDAKNGMTTALIDVAALLVFRYALPKEHAGMAILFALFCGMQMISAKMNGFSLVAGPSYLLAIIGIFGIAGIVRWFRDERATVR